jgi:hypothetical protein
VASAIKRNVVLHHYYYHRYLAPHFLCLRTVLMGIGLILVDFLQRIAVGVGMVLSLLLVFWLGIPRRSTVASSRPKIANHPSH